MSELQELFLALSADAETPERRAALRLLSRVQLQPETGCWVVPTVAPNDYPQLYIKPRQWGAHRVMRAVVDGMSVRDLDRSDVVMHSCDVRTCVRPSHLSIGTILENNRDCQAKGRLRGLPIENAKRTHCPQGHALVEGNLVPSHQRLGYRRCLVCSRARSIAHRSKAKGYGPTFTEAVAQELARTDLDRIATAAAAKGDRS